MANVTGAYAPDRPEPHFHLYANGREFGVCYDRTAAGETIAEYRAEYPHTRYTMHKVWRCAGQVKRS